MKGDYEGARADWSKAQELSPNSYVAQQAKANLAQLDKLAGQTPQPASGKSAKPPLKR